MLLFASRAEAEVLYLLNAAVKRNASEGAFFTETEPDFKGFYSYE